MLPSAGIVSLQTEILHGDFLIINMIVRNWWQTHKQHDSINLIANMIMV